MEHSNTVTKRVADNHKELQHQACFFKNISAFLDMQLSVLEFFGVGKKFWQTHASTTATAFSVLQVHGAYFFVWMMF